ncbi:cysteine desulfurase family protein [Denitrobacterium detoxificans]|jgi:cysteine desulfurase|uniref:cysteine desulfurase family protein n=1 Tax=Denitrobacterium detoxificans TaxID=79604 RepID=UPI0026E9EB43|nr:cysteine desulfurase family protein [Denitrobacterium detoxificans]MBE6466803.1 cysteine desulfurase [Denitrobacterium detoxificans]
MPQQIIYLDHAAATPMDPRVRAAMAPFETELFFNPSSPYAPAVSVRSAYEQARADLAHAIGGKPADIIITAGATESINLAFTCLDNPDGTPSDAHVITTAIEHASVLASAKAHDHTLVGVTPTGRVLPAEIEAAIKPTTRLISVGLANNELGTIQPIRTIAEIVRAERLRRLQAGDDTPLFLHCDASQGAGQTNINISSLGVDMLTCNAGKIYGPKQVGLLWAQPDVILHALVHGGGQERNLRSGTENVAGAVGFARALTLAVEDRKFEAERLQVLRDGLQRYLTREFPQAVVSGHKKHRLPGHLHISFPGIDAERIVFLLEEKNVLVGTGAACAANKDTRSHVLEAIGMDPQLADGSLRLTLGHLSTRENTVVAAQLISAAIHSEYERMAR